MQFSEDLLIESPTARSAGVSEIKSQSREQEILSRVKVLFFAVWEGTLRITRQQLADFYEVPVATIDSNYKRHTDEFESDGVKVFRGKELNDARGILPLASKSSQETIYTPAGALRMGFILRDSPVAKEVRTAAIRIIQGVSDVFDPATAFSKLVEGHSGLDRFSENQQPKIAALYEEGIFKDAYKALKKKYPDGKLPGLGVDQLKEFFALFATYTDRWVLRTDLELSSSHAPDRYGYPHLTSDAFSVEIDGQIKQAVIMFQFCDFLVDDRYVAECDSRRYIKSAKNLPGVDLSWLFFVAPFGATPAAVNFIQQEIRPDSKGYMGVILVKDLANFLYAQASQTRNSNLLNGEINKRFRDLMGYEFPVVELVTQYDLFG
jgi:hypothetical protein